jgi:hypothetical protein
LKLVANALSSETMASTSVSETKTPGAMRGISLGER